MGGSVPVYAESTGEHPRKQVGQSQHYRSNPRQGGEGALAACGDRLHLDLATKRQLGRLVYCASRSLSLGKEAGIERIDLFDIGQVNESKINIDDV